MVMASALVVAMAVMMWEGGDGPDLGNGDGECAGGVVAVMMRGGGG